MSAGLPRVMTWDLRPGQVVTRDSLPLSSPVVVHDLREATVPTPGREVAVWLLGGWVEREVGKFPPFVVNAGAEETWALIEDAP